VPRGEIRFDHIHFHYGAGRAASADAPTRVIGGLSLTVRPGEKVGLVGRSGAGKSTLVNLLLRFYDLEGGRILIDGQDIAHVKQDSLRAEIGMVTQDTSLLHRSVRDNILYGRPDAGDTQVIAAARQAEAHEFILNLEDLKGRKGYDAHVGERGVKLSGGQRQRIAIARVLLKNAPILVLDEATSALDSEVESEIQASLVTLMRGKTVIAIAHGCRRSRRWTGSSSWKRGISPKKAHTRNSWRAAASTPSSGSANRAASSHAKRRNKRGRHRFCAARLRALTIRVCRHSQCAGSPPSGVKLRRARWRRRRRR
jgi:ABC-type multidrug transport system fused ATPase/permease subunit